MVGTDTTGTGSGAGAGGAGGKLDGSGVSIASTSETWRCWSRFSTKSWTNWLDPHVY